MEIRQTTPSDAYDTLQRDPTSVYLDVRTQEEIAAGFTDVSNVRGGFGGARDDTGRVVIPGWREAGLPVETGVGDKA